VSEVDKQQDGVGGDPARPAHENVRTWKIYAAELPGDHGAVVGEVSAGPRRGESIATAQVYVSPIDGAFVVEIDTDSEHEDVRVRVRLNDALDPVFDETIAQGQAPEPELRKSEQLYRLVAEAVELRSGAARQTDDGLLIEMGGRGYLVHELDKW
jgi:hypothetical protein